MENENKKIKTIGERSDEIAETYFRLYQSFKQRMKHDEAVSMAKHDIRVKQFIYEFAMDKLELKILESRGGQL